MVNTLERSEYGPTPKVPKENFREGQTGFYADRLYEKTTRVDRFLDILDEIGTSPAETTVRTRLFDLVFYNCYGNIFPQVNSAGDFIGVVNEKRQKTEAKRKKYKNCISLAIVKGELAVVGGFVDINEDPHTTAVREAREESSIGSLSHFVPFAERSRYTRDDRFTVVSTCAAALFDPSEKKLEGKDDAEKAIIVPLFIERPDGTTRLNKKIFKAGKHKDIDGKIFEHSGMRADHREILIGLYHYWQDHSKVMRKKKPVQLSLSETIKNKSKIYKQPPFESIIPHEETTDHYESISVDGHNLLLTPNIEFALENAEKVFIEEGVDNPTIRAAEFVLSCVKADILPLFPQRSVATDCLIVKDNSLVVAKYANGEYRLPGGFYSPEKGQSKSGETLASAAESIVAEKFGRHFITKLYAGATKQDGDPRFPTTSHLFVGVQSGDHSPQPGKALPPDTEIVTIPIWADAARTRLSDEILNGQWALGHNALIRHVLEDLQLLFQEQTDETAEDVLLTQRIV